MNLKNKNIKKYFTLLLLLPFFLGLSSNLVAQPDSLLRKVPHNLAFKFTDGIYLNFDQVKNNKPISKARIVTNANKNSLDYFERLLENDFIYLYDDLGIELKLPVKQVWGFCSKSVIYIHWNSEFNRLPVMGVLSHFVANKTTMQSSSNGYNAYRYSQYYMPNTTSTYEMKQYVLNFETGEIMEFNYKTVEVLLMKDEELYAKFMEISRKQKKKLKYMYLREFNKKHPLYIPVYTH